MNCSLNYDRPIVYINECQDYDASAIDAYNTLGDILTNEHITLNELSSRLELSQRLTGIVLRLKPFGLIKLTKKFPNLKFLATATTGLTHIPIQFINHPQIRLYSLRDCKSELKVVTATSELTIGLILSLIRKIPFAHYDVSTNLNWDRYNYTGRQATGMKISIIGYGRLGANVALICSSLGMSVGFYDPYVTQYDSSFEIHKYNSLDEALREADIISLHASYEKGDPPILSKSALDFVKHGCLIVNTARGELIDEEYLCEKLREGQISGIAVDVLANEDDVSYNLQSSPLVSAAREGYNVIITPHIGGCCADAMRLTERILANKVQAMESLK